MNETEYHQQYRQSIDDSDGFWAAQAKKTITWFTPWNKVLTGNFEKGNCEWFTQGQLNASFNCIDRHLPEKENNIAIIWEGNNPNETRFYTYAQLHEQVCIFANVLTKHDIKKGDIVCIYLPMIPEAIFAMLACARIGAMHSVVFGGFSPHALEARIKDGNCKLVVTANVGLRGEKIIPLKANVDMALKNSASVEKVLVIKRTADHVDWDYTRDYWYEEEAKTVNNDCPCTIMDANDPLFVLYTSGSTGKPKGIVHATGGYLVYSAMTFSHIFDYRPDEIYWCTADVGWITGHSYGVYGPLSQGATILIYEGIPNYPNPSRYWEIIDKYKVNIFYTSPTAIRALRHDGDKWVKQTRRRSLRILGTVGEPINPDVWEWYFDVVGNGHCPIVDTWWQTETGGIMISPLPYATPLKPGSACWPFLGIEPSIVDEKGNEVPPEVMGKLIIKRPWPGMMKTIYNDHKRFMENYFSEYPGNYLTGDQAKKDQEGYYWILGRFDDVLKISGHRIGTGEVENAFLTNDQVAEAAVVAVPHDIKGETIYAFITLKAGHEGTDALKKELISIVRNDIGAIATPEYIQWAPALPKTRSGKIMRRLLRKIANNETDDLGDLSTLSDPNVLDELIKDIQNK